MRLSASFASPWRCKDAKDVKTGRLPGGMYLSPGRRRASFEDVSRLRRDLYTSLGDANSSFWIVFQCLHNHQWVRKLGIFERYIVHTTCYLLSTGFMY